MNEIKRLLELSKKLPEGLRSDWEGTNHFELQSSDPKEEYFWLTLSAFWDKSVWEHPGYLKQIGLLMDIAATLKQAEPMLKKLNGQSL